MEKAKRYTPSVLIPAKAAAIPISHTLNAVEPSSSSMADASSLGVVRILRKLQSLGFCLDLDISSRVSAQLTTEELSSLFNRILSLFLKEIHLRHEIRPLPALLGDGRSADLFKLYLVVRRKGGYDLVSATRSWASVADEIGLDSAVGSSLKLIYVKYLVALDRWWSGVLADKAAGGWARGKKDSESMVGELEVHVRGKEKHDMPSPLSGSKRDHFLTPSRGSGRVLHDGKCDKDDGVVILEQRAVNGELSYLKRKREALVGMLNWVRSVAKYPKDPSVGKMLSNGKGQAIGVLFSQAILARRAMFIKRIPRLKTNEPLVQEGLKAFPSSNEDCMGPRIQNNERAEYNKRFPSLVKRNDSGCCSREPLAECDMDKGVMAGGEEHLGKRRPGNPNLFSAVIPGTFSSDKPQSIPISPSCQVNVPDWIEKPSNTSCDADDLKWLGTRIWPPKNEENKLWSEQDPAKRGGQDNCQCERSGSVECVRFHVAENRIRLKRELGSAFYRWGFDRMGEEVSLLWTREEEQKFKDIVHLNRSSTRKNFWNQLHLSFPLKGRKNLASYYYNVFLLARRTYQNRVTPNRTDSDDDETEFGFLSKPFGHSAVRISEPVNCSQNAQYVDLDEYVDGD